MKRSSSFRRTLCPMPRTSSASVAIPSSSVRGGGRCGHALAHLLAGSLNRLHDVHVAGAATDVARDGPADHVLAPAPVVHRSYGDGILHAAPPPQLFPPDGAVATARAGPRRTNTSTTFLL